LQAEDVDVPAIYENDQLTEELQVLYSGDVTDGIVGFFYIDASAFNEFDVLLNTTAPLLGLPGLNATTLGDVQTQSWAIFGDFTFDLVQAFDRLGIDITRPWLSGLELTFGGRYTSDERTSRVLRRTFFDPNLSPDLGGPPLSERGAPQVTSDFEGSETFTDFTPKASISYQPTPDYTLYFTYSEGFKGGSFDPRGSTSAAPDFNQDGTVSEQEIFEFMKFEPETVESFEFGLKSTLFNGRITSNIAYFISDYTDVQVPGSVGVDTDGDGVNDSFAGVTTNAGEASIDGFEFEGNARIAEDVLTGGDFFTARGTMGYINAEYDRFVDASGENVADERVFQNTPEWTGNISATYGLPLDLGLARGELAFTASGSYRGETFQFEEPNPFLTQEAYWLLDLSVNWTDESGRVNVSLHGRNLTDERYIVSGYNFVALGEDGSITPTLGVEGTLTAFYGDPRTFTGVIEVRF
jgi:iron complex outermembrane receptor protein